MNPTIEQFIENLQTDSYSNRERSDIAFSFMRSGQPFSKNLMAILETAWMAPEWTEDHKDYVALLDEQDYCED